MKQQHPKNRKAKKPTEITGCKIIYVNLNNLRRNAEKRLHPASTKFKIITPGIMYKFE